MSTSRKEWKNALHEYLSSPFVYPPGPTVAPVKPGSWVAAIVNLLQMFHWGFFDSMKALPPILKRMLKKSIQKDSPENFNRRLTEIEQPPKMIISKKVKPQQSDAVKRAHAAVDKLFQFKTNSDAIKSSLLLHMQVIYFATNREEIKAAVNKLFLDMILADQIFEPYRNDEFRNCLKEMINNLVEQNDAYAYAYTKYYFGNLIKYMGWYHKDRQHLADTAMKECCDLASKLHIANYRLDRSKAKAFYDLTQRLQPSDQSQAIDFWVKILCVTGVLFFLSIVLWTKDYFLLGPLMASASGIIFCTYAGMGLIDANNAINTYSANIHDKLDSILEIKLISKKQKDSFEFKLESRIPIFDLPTERIAPLGSSAIGKIPRKRVAKAKTPEDKIAIISDNETQIEAQRSFADANGNIYYLLSNKSFFRYNAAELDARKESIRHDKLSLSTVMQNSLERSSVIGNTDSKDEGMKYVSANEKGVDREKYPIKFKFLGKPYGSLRIAMSSRDSRPEETELLEREAIIQSPKLFYRH
jgi:hypothetical protein